MLQCQFSGGYVSIPRWSQANYTSLGTSIEALRPKSCNASSIKAWIETSHCRIVIGLKKMIKISSPNTAMVG